MPRARGGGKRGRAPVSGPRWPRDTRDAHAPAHLGRPRRRLHPPCFLFWTEATVGDLRAHLRSEDLDERASWMGALLREANTRDVWLYVQPAGIRALRPRLLRHLGRTRAMRAFLLRLPDRPWPPPEARGGPSRWGAWDGSTWLPPPAGGVPARRGGPRGGGCPRVQTSARGDRSRSIREPQTRIAAGTAASPRARAVADATQAVHAREVGGADRSADRRAAGRGPGRPGRPRIQAEGRGGRGGPPPLTRRSLRDSGTGRCTTGCVGGAPREGALHQVPEQQTGGRRRHDGRMHE